VEIIILCDVVGVNMKMHPLTSDNGALVDALYGEKVWGVNSPHLNPVEYLIWGALQQLVYHRHCFETLSTQKTSYKPAGSIMVKMLSIAL